MTEGESMTDRELLELLVQKLSSLERNMTTKDELQQLCDTVATREELEQTHQALARLERGLDQTHQALIRMENEQGEKIRALFDAREVQIDVNERILDTLNRMEGKIDRVSLKVSAHEALLQRVK